MPFRAVHAQTGESFILDADPPDRIARLRALGRADLLGCPTCEAPMRVRAGAHRVPHFAHKHRNDCPNSDTAALAAARLALYRWLRAKLGDTVTVEHWIPHAGLPRPIDVFFEHEGKAFAYWLFERGLRPEPRKSLRKALSEFSVTWVFLEPMHRVGTEPDSIQLTTTERKLTTRRHRFDAPYGGKSLHYLVSANASLRTYRGIRCIHSPSLYAGVPVETALDELMISPKSGAPVHPGELEAARTYEQAILEEEEARERAKREIDQRSFQWSTNAGRDGSATRKADRQMSATPATPLSHKCMLCDRIVGDDEWAVKDGATGLVKCKVCLRASPPPSLL